MFISKSYRLLSIKALDSTIGVALRLITSPLRLEKQRLLCCSHSERFLLCLHQRIISLRAEERFILRWLIPGSIHFDHLLLWSVTSFHLSKDRMTVTIIDGRLKSFIIVMVIDVTR